MARRSRDELRHPREAAEFRPPVAPDSPPGLAKATAKLEPAAFRQLFARLAWHGVIPESTAAAVRGPKHLERVDLATAGARRFTRRLPSGTITEFRDLGFIAMLAHSFARVSAAVAMNVRDVYARYGR